MKQAIKGDGNRGGSLIDEIKMLPLPERTRLGAVTELARQLVILARTCDGSGGWPCVEVFANRAQTIGVYVREQGMKTMTETNAETGKVKIWVLKK